MNKELEEVIKRLEDDISVGEYSTTKTEILETLLKELERLQEENSQYKRIKYFADSVTKKEIDEAIKRVNKEFIAKDKIKGKIIMEEYKIKHCTNSILANTYKARIKFGQELLEDI